MTIMGNTVFDSLGVYLPPKEVTTDEIVRGCAQEISLPLARLTGIHSRRRAGEDEFAIDLAEKAVRDCLRRGGIAADEVDAIVCTNISRWDGKNQIFFEPPTSLRVKQRIGLANALTIDLSNACAGMWTGVFLVDALIRSGAIRRGIVVSGEYITHLIDTAQKEITGFMDSQVASLTLGDAGVAVSLSRGESESCGLVDFDLYTLSKFARFCIAKPTETSHGGAAMHTDSIKVSEAVIPHAAKHAFSILAKNNWGESQIQHVIPHQTSELTMRAGLREIRRIMKLDLTNRLINNLANRGNTSSNAHFLALHDSIHNQKIDSGDSIVFCISGSGQSTGTALYVMDDLPERMRAADAKSKGLAPQSSFVLPVQIELEALGLAYAPQGSAGDTVELIASATRDCLSRSSYAKSDVDLMIAACTYRSEFIMEPAIAALVACELEMNDLREPEDAGKTFAFDLANGEVGLLKSIKMAGELMRAGRARQVLVVSSDVENNLESRPEHLAGVRSMAGAMMLREATGEAGFFDFLFRDFPEHHLARYTFGHWNEENRAVLECNSAPNLHELYLDCVEETVTAMLQQSGFSMDEVNWIVPPHIDQDFVKNCTQRLGLNDARIINVLDTDHTGNPMSSTTPLALATASRDGRIQAGDLVLFVSVSPGIQVACALYRA